MGHRLLLGSDICIHYLHDVIYHANYFLYGYISFNYNAASRFLANPLDPYDVTNHFLHGVCGRVV